MPSFDHLYTSEDVFINTVVQRALAGKNAAGVEGRNARFQHLPNNSFESNIFPDAFETPLRDAFAYYEMTPKITHDQKHNRIRRIKLSLPADEVAKGFAVYNEQVTAALKEHTGLDWSFEPTRQRYMSSFISPEVANETQEKFAEIDRVGTATVSSVGKDERRAQVVAAYREMILPADRDEFDAASKPEATPFAAKMLAEGIPHPLLRLANAREEKVTASSSVIELASDYVAAWMVARQSKAAQLADAKSAPQQRPGR